MFGGLGFVAKEMAAYPEKWALACGLGVAAAIGILLLWMLACIIREGHYERRQVEQGGI